MATKTLNRLVSAGYFYFLRGDKDPVPAVLDYISSAYEPQAVAGGFNLGLESSRATTVDSFISKDRAGSARLDLRRSLIGNVLGVGLIKYTDMDGQPEWKSEIKFFEDCRAKLTAEGLEVLGNTVIGVSDRAIKENLSRFQESIGKPLSDIDSTLKDNTIHQFLGDPNQQYFFIEDTAEPDITEVITEDFPHIVWLMQRMTREMLFFDDRMKAIETEQDDIDRKLSRIFHQKVGKVLTPALANLLDEQINDLSTMYSMMATDLHLVAEAIATFEKEIATIEMKAAQLGENDERAFPRYRLQSFNDYLAGLIKARESLSQSLDNTKAAIDITQTQAELLRGSQGLAIQEQTRELLNQNVLLQDERASLQAAAAVVELVIIFYYSLVSWKTVAPKESVEALSSIVKFGTVGVFSASVVVLTHYIGASLHKKRWQVIPISIAAVFTALSLAAMVLLPGLGNK